MRPRRFAGEIAARKTDTQYPIRRFNEAPAFRRGNLGLEQLILGGGALASMRPRRFAGEIDKSPNRRAVESRASMRPRRFAGEIIAVGVTGGGRIRASMRPRRFAGEIAVQIRNHPLRAHASMRPRRFAGEIPIILRNPNRPLMRFNEAPAFRRGNRGPSTI